MLNVYKYHTKPNQLDEYENRVAIIPELAYYYARDIIKGIWPEAEPYIMKDPHYAYYYALYRIEGRWEAAEPYIMKDEYWWNKYKTQFGVKQC